MPADQLTIEKSRDLQTEVEILHVAGPMTLATLFEFQAALREAIGPKILIDLSNVPYMDSAGLGALLSFHVSCSRHDRTYAVAGASSRLRTMIEVAKVDKLLNLHDTIGNAERSLRA